MLEVNSIKNCERVLFDVGHPAHVHLFKNLAKKLMANNYQVLFAVREKESEIKLLEHEKLPYSIIGKNKSGLFLKIISVFAKNIRLLILMTAFKPDIIFSHGSFYSSQTGWLFRIPSVVLEDTCNPEQTMLYKPFASLILSPFSVKKRISAKQVFYNGFHELSYIETKNNLYQSRNGIDKKILVRLVSWKASHDMQHKGLSDKELSELLVSLSENANLFISSETNTFQIERLKKTIEFDHFHELIKECSLLISEGSTTAIEGCLSGVPTIYFGIQNLDIIKDLESKGVLICADSLNKIKEGILLTKQEGYVTKFHENLSALLSETINLNELLYYIIDQFPKSLKVLKETKQVIHQQNFTIN